MKTGLANMAIGVGIALIGALVTGVSYSMVGSGGGSYVVAYGAIIVGAWRFLLGLFQVLRGAVSGSQAGNTVPQAPRAASTASGSAIGMPASAPRSIVVQYPSGALHFVGWVLIADAAFRLYGLGSLLWHIRVPFAELLYNVPFLVIAIALPVILVVGGLVVGALLLRDLPTAVPMGIGLCVVSLLFQAYGLWRLLSNPTFSVPWLAWAFASVHIAIYIMSFVVLLRSLDRRGLAAPPHTNAPASPGMPR